MPYKLLTLAQAAERLGMNPGDLRSMALEGRIESELKGENYFFSQEVIEYYLTEHIISGNAAPEILAKSKMVYRNLSDLCPEGCICCDLPGSSRASIIRNLVELADKSGFVYDPADLREQITKREEKGSTCIGDGIAIPHTMTREEGFFSESFVCIARLAKPMYYNTAYDDSKTDILIFTCSMNTDEHLFMLSKISELCQHTHFKELLRLAENDGEMREALLKAEEEWENLLNAPKKNRR